MNIAQLQEQRRKEAYQQAQVKGTHQLAPRPGYYVFNSIDTKPTTNGQQVQIVRALWKSLSDPSFLEGLYFEVATPSFYAIDTQGPKHLNVPELMGRLIVVNEVKLALNGQKTAVVLKWDVLDEAPIINKRSNLFRSLTPSYNDISKLSDQYGIDDNPISDQVYDEPDDE